MGKRTWTKCNTCQRKLHRKKGQTICVGCQAKKARMERKKERLAQV